MTHRFFVPNLPNRVDNLAEPVEIAGTEAHHLLNVLRLRPGDSIEVFDGQGTVASAELVHCGRNDASARLRECHVVPPSTPSVVLATALPKGDRVRWLIEKVTEVGVDRVLPLNTSRSVVDPRDSKLAKLRLTAIAAAKQCGRVTLPVIEQPLDWESLLQQECRPERRILLAKREGTRLPDLLAERPTDESREILIIVGPEGGLSEDEVAAIVAREGVCINLGDLILRIETAGVLLAGVLCAARAPQ